MKNKTAAGFTYLVEVLNRAGVVVDSERVHNLTPTEGLNHKQSVVYKGASQITAWYVGLYEGDYTPLAGDTAASFPGTATEITAYDEATRAPLILGAVASGAVDNSASRAEFTFNAAKTVRGGFVISSSAKGAATGVLISAVKFATAKAMDAGYVLRVTAIDQATST